MLDFTEIYDEQLPRIYGFIAYRVATRADAEDLTQQTFERALAHWGDYDGRRGSVTTWLIAIARNLVIDHQRRPASRSPALPLHELEQSQLPQSSDLGADLGLSPELAVALTDLDARGRELIALRFGADLAGREIAAVTGLTVANVHQIISRALRSLRESIESRHAAP